MRGASHQMFGVFFSLAVGLFIGLPFLLSPIENASLVVGFLVAVSIGSLMPDIDHPGSTVGRVFGIVSRVIGRVFGHRGITHSILGTALVLWLTYKFLGLGSVLFWGFTLGYVSHIIGDMLTPRGCPLFWPFRLPIRFPFNVKTGTSGEFWPVFLSILSFFAVLIWRYQSDILAFLDI